MKISVYEYLEINKNADWFHTYHYSKILTPVYVSMSVELRLRCAFPCIVYCCIANGVILDCKDVIYFDTFNICWYASSVIKYVSLSYGKPQNEEKKLFRLSWCKLIYILVFRGEIYLWIRECFKRGPWAVAHSFSPCVSEFFVFKIKESF